MDRSAPFVKLFTPPKVDEVAEGREVADEMDRVIDESEVADGTDPSDCEVNASIGARDVAPPATPFSGIELGESECASLIRFL